MPEGCLLYYITDRAQFPGDETARRRALLSKIAEAASCGINYIQLREKDLTTCELEALARDAVSAIRETRTTGDERPTTCLLINSRTDVALAAGADGVHLRADDVSPHEVRRVVDLAGCRPSNADRFRIAVSCHTQPDVMQAESEGADFAVFAPVFEKRDRPKARPTGLDMLREACRATIPVLALGGVTLENAASCLNAGVAGIAGIRLFQENRIEEVVRALRAGR